MRNIFQDYPLKKHNTFAMEVNAKSFFYFYDSLELVDFLTHYKEDLHRNKVLILGGGSNILFLDDFQGTIIQSRNTEISRIAENAEFVWLKVGAGTNWDDFVGYTVEQNLWGLENLSHIPGTVGAAPVQNIGAYGVEVKELISKIETINLETFQTKEFANQDCEFDYRSSVFKTKLKAKQMILSVSFKLSKTPNPKTNYKDLKLEFGKQGINSPNQQQIRDAIVSIRKRKLPEPDVLPNAGSFFKNPIVSGDFFLELLKIYPNMPNYPLRNGKVKIPAAWLIQECGWKGKRTKNVGVHEKQALVLVNYANATGTEILNLSREIIKSVKQKFKLSLEREVNVY